MVERAARYREVFAVAEFWALFAAHLLSVLGDQFARLAVSVLVFVRTDSAGLTALTYALTFLPDLIGGPLLSGLADRYPRRTVMIVTDLARAVLVAAMALPGAPLVALWGLLVGAQLLSSPFNAARAATLPAVLEGDRYRLAVSVSSMAYQLALLLGFGAAGVLVAAVNPASALLIDAATFVVSAALIRFGLAHRPAPSASTTTAPVGWTQAISAGTRLLWDDRRLRALVALLCLCAWPVAAEGLAVPYAADLGAGPAAVGLLLAAAPAGAVVGMLLINRLPPAARLNAMWPLAVASGAVLIPCVTRPGLLVTVLLWAVSGAAMAYLIPANAELVHATPDEQRGQVFGLAATAMRVSQGLTVLAAGVTADQLRPPIVVGIAGAIGAALATAGWLADTRVGRRHRAGRPR